MRISERRLRQVISKIIREEYNATIDFLTGSSGDVDILQQRSMAGIYTPGIKDYDERHKYPEDPYVSIRQQLHDDLGIRDGRAWSSIVAEKLEDLMKKENHDIQKIKDKYVSYPLDLVIQIFEDIRLKLLPSYEKFVQKSMEDSPQRRHSQHALNIGKFKEFMYDPDPEWGERGERSKEFVERGYKVSLQSKSHIEGAFRKFTLAGINKFLKKQQSN